MLTLLFGWQNKLHAAATIKLYAYSSDGTNTGTARLGKSVSMQASVSGSSATTVNWSLSGAGSITSAGVYTAPAAMPSSSSVTITATLTSDTTVTASYTFTLINPVPTIYGTNPSTLPTDGTDTVTVPGTGYVQGTVIQVNGANVATTFVSPTSVTVQIPVSATASGTLTLNAVNPAPGGGTSAAVNVQIAKPTITLTAYSSDGTNTGTAQLGRNVSITSNVTGTNNASLTWTVSGAGTVSSSGIYTAPAAMPTNTSVTVTAALADNSAIATSYSFKLVNPVPTIYGTNPAQLPTGGTDTVTIPGTGFVSGTVIYVNGSAVPTTYQSPTTVVAQIPVSASATGSLTLTAVNPAPGGGTSAAVQAPVAKASITLTAYSSDGTNTGTARLGLNVSIVANVTGAANSTLTWTVTGGGTVASSSSNTGLYTAPAAMPSSASVTVTAALSDNSGISASYNLTLINPVPVLNQLNPYQLTTGMTNAITITGSGFTPSTVVSVNGTQVTTTYSSPTSIVAQIPIADSVQGNVTLTAVNPTPGGGTSTSFSAPIKPLTLLLWEFDETGASPTTTSLGHSMQFVPKLHGSGDANFNWSVNWSVTGGGTISSSGIYTAPFVMPANPSITVTATLAQNSAVTATYTFTLGNPSPAVNASSPVSVTPGSTTTVTFTGSGFTPNTTLTVNGASVATTYLSATAVKAPIAASSSAASPLEIAAVNPTPGGGTSSTYLLSLTNSTVVNASVSTTPGQYIPPDFVGLSHEWGDAQWFMGSSAMGVNSAYRQLISNIINPGAPLLIRVGGYTTDTTTEPSDQTVLPFAELNQALGVHFSLGVNLGSDNVQLAVDQAVNYIQNMPAGSIDTFEVGNEPDVYPTNGLRSSTYSVTDYFNEFTTWSTSILQAEMGINANVRVMGAAWGAVQTWQNNVAQYEQLDSQYLNYLSQHIYGGYTESGQAFNDDYLLTPIVSTQNPTKLQPYVSAIHGLNQKFRIGESNTIDNGGIAGISNAFSAALYAIDTMFEYANAGLDGINWHGTSGCTYCPFTFGVHNVEGINYYQLQHVAPLYYGLIFFHQAAGNGSNLLPVTLSASQGTLPNIKIWSTVDANNNVEVAIINKDENFAGTVAVTLPGYGTAKVTRLVAPSFVATSGVSLGGQTFDGSLDGTLVNSASGETQTPSNGKYYIGVQPTSAVLLTLQPAS